MVQPSNDGMMVSESQEGQGGGVLIGEIGSLDEVQHGHGSRRPSFSSTLSDESIGTSLAFSHSSTGSVASDSDVMSNGDGGGGGVGGVESAGGAAAGRQARGAHESGTKRPLTEEEQQRVVEQQHQTSNQQLRKACDLCTKVRKSVELNSVSGGGSAGNGSETGAYWLQICWRSRVCRLFF